LAVHRIFHNWGCTVPGARIERAIISAHFDRNSETTLAEAPGSNWYSPCSDNATSVVCSSLRLSVVLGACQNATGLRRITSCLFPCRGKLCRLQRPASYGGVSATASACSETSATPLGVASVRVSDPCKFVRLSCRILLADVKRKLYFP